MSVRSKERTRHLVTIKIVDIRLTRKSIKHCLRFSFKREKETLNTFKQVLNTS